MNMTFRPLRIPRFLVAVMLAMLPVAAQALTVDQRVTPASLAEKPKQFSVKVARNEGGLITFTVIRLLSEPKYLVAHLAVVHQGKTLSESHTPLFSSQRENPFHFTIAPDSLADSTFELGESFFQGSGNTAVPLPGTINYQFHLRDFVPESLLQARPAK
jgi:hypothetical protein